MKIFSSRILWGVLLIVGGIIFLLESLGVAKIGGLWGIIFAAAGAVFLLAFVSERQHWWAAIPGMVLLGLGVLIGVNEWFPAIGSVIGGAMFLAFLALAFILVYLATKGREWWALIPGGVLATLAVVVGFEALFPAVFRDELFVGVMMLGFGATFALIGLLQSGAKGMHWAYWPAGVMGLIGLIFAAIGVKWAGLIFPALLVAVGAYLIIRNMRKQSE